MKILSLFNHPQVVSNHNWWTPLTSIVFFFLQWESMGSINCLFTNILQNIYFCVQQEKEIHTGLKQL